MIPDRLTGLTQAQCIHARLYRCRCPAPLWWKRFLEMRLKEMKNYVNQLHEMADMIAYNAPYADQHMLNFIPHKYTSIEQQEKIKSKENRLNSSSAPTYQFSPGILAHHL
jgi:hypothetical protein